MPTSTTGQMRIMRLFLISYAPLAVLILLRMPLPTWGMNSTTVAWSFLLLAAMVGFLDAWRLPRQALRRGAHRVQLSNVKDESGSVAAYLATYLLPFLGVTIMGWREVLSLLLYFVVLLVVFLRSDLALVNPTLYIYGWRVVSGIRETEKAESQRVLALIPQECELASGKPTDFVDFGQFLVLKRSSELNA